MQQRKNTILVVRQPPFVNVLRVFACVFFFLFVFFTNENKQPFTMENKKSKTATKKKMTPKTKLANLQLHFKRKMITH